MMTDLFVLADYVHHPYWGSQALLLVKAVFVRHPWLRLQAPLAIVNSDF